MKHCNQDSNDNDPAVTPEAIEQAQLNPCGWVYLVEGAYDRQSRPPMNAIIGAWRVDARGRIVVSDYIGNSHYRPRGLRLGACG